MSKTERKTLTDLKDWRDTPITVGSVVFYPRASGRCVEIVEGEVIEVFATKGKYSEEWQPRIKIKPLRSSRFNRATNWRDEPAGDAILTVIENVTVYQGK